MTTGQPTSIHHFCVLLCRKSGIYARGLVPSSGMRARKYSLLAQSRFWPSSPLQPGHVP